MNLFHHTGDLGDIIASFPVIRKLGGGKLVISDASFPLGYGPRETMRGKRFAALQPIFHATDYISDIVWEDNPKGITHDIASFRGNHNRYVFGENLTEWQGRHFDLKMPAAPEPWLQIKDAPQHNKIVVGKTLRYPTSFFPWQLIGEKYGDELLFVGLPTEYLAFAGHVKREVEYRHTPTLLDAAKVVAGSKFVICNQSVLHWLAAGLGHTYIQETFEGPYARTAIVPRENAIHTDSNENLERMYDFLKLDKEWMKKHLIPPPKVNLSTSAGDFRKNLSTSAEIFTKVDAIGIHGN